MVAGSVNVGLLHHVYTECVIDIDLDKTRMLGRELERRARHACLESVCNLLNRLDGSLRIEECVVFFKVYCGRLVADNERNCADKRVLRSVFWSMSCDCNDCILVASDKTGTILSDIC